jgi:hypothetical protein
LLGALLVSTAVYSDFREIPAARVEQTALVIKSEFLHELIQKPGFRLGKPGMVSNRDIWHSCIRFAHFKNTLVVYSPSDKSCTRLSEFKRNNPDTGLNTSFSVLSDSGRLFSESNITVVKPVPQGAPVQCVCDEPPTNHSPQASVFSGSPQETEPGTAITPIDFRGTDSDGDAMSHRYSYLFNAEPFENLPTGLTSHCSTATGWISCVLNGTAPAEPGEYQITIHISDGRLGDTATAILQVNPVDQADDIFVNGFEADL